MYVGVMVFAVCFELEVLGNLFLLASDCMLITAV